MRKQQRVNPEKILAQVEVGTYVGHTAGTRDNMTWQQGLLYGTDGAIWINTCFVEGKLLLPIFSRCGSIEHKMSEMTSCLSSSMIRLKMLENTDASGSRMIWQRNSESSFPLIVRLLLCFHSLISLSVFAGLLL